MEDRVQDVLDGFTTEVARLRQLAGTLGGLPVPSAVVGEIETGASNLEGLQARVIATLRGDGAAQQRLPQQQALGLNVIQAQEEERRRVAREIHDGPAQLLANVVLRIDVCQRLAEQNPQRYREELNQLKELVRLSLQDVRKVIFDLRPMALDDLGLVPALRAYVKAFQGRTATEVELVTFGGERRYSPAFEVAIFRLVQETLTNVDKHARASRVQITIEHRVDELKVTVRDDGVGFDVGRVRGQSAGVHFGLAGMQERVQLIGGRMEIDSQPEHGTRLQFIFPLT